MRDFRAVLVLTLLPSSGMAQSVVGKAIVEGWPVTPYDNRTWAFAGNGRSACAELSKRLSSRGYPVRWVPSTHFDRTCDGRSDEWRNYRVRLQRIGVWACSVYANTILLGENMLIQLITCQLGNEYTYKRADLHAEFIDASKVTE